MADILLREEDLTFASTMVHTLNTILLTSTELFQLRNQLKDLKTPVLLTCALQRASFVCAPRPPLGPQRLAGRRQGCDLRPPSPVSNTGPLGWAACEC